jgi:curved DNA-binding protein CbpA
MSNYYDILGIKKTATMDEINDKYHNYLSSNQNTKKIDEAFYVLNDYHRRRKYDTLLEKRSVFSIFKVPFFGYDFDEKYVKNYSNNNKVVVNSAYGEIKRYKIDDKKYIIYEKKNINGIVDKLYYLEVDGVREVISKDKIDQIKKDYYKNSEKTSENSGKLLKDKPIN